MPSVEWNLQTWNTNHDWRAQGDEWSGMAEYCGQPYERWKQSLIETFMLPYLGADRDVLEIAPGHGRWSETLIDHARHVTLVDLSPVCIEACRKRFADRKNVGYLVNDGTSVALENETIDFAWSFDSFVHMEPPVIDAYIGEFARVLRPGGHLVIHHAARRHWSLPILPVAGRLGMPGRVAARLLSQGRLRDSGRRAAVSAEVVAEIIARHGLELVGQTSSWGPGNQYTVGKYRDTISTATRPTT
jgi:ubiquinone/menaquinone biosynthesis C-methylase UbiE